MAVESGYGNRYVSIDFAVNFDGDLWRTSGFWHVEVWIVGHFD